jgi:hypothetical protein
MSIEAYDYGKQDGVREEQEAIINILKEELKDSEEPMLGTKGGWRDYLITKIKEKRLESVTQADTLKAESDKNERL